MLNFLMRNRGGQNYISPKMAKMFTNMGVVWLRHVWWTREVILSIINSLPSTDTSVTKLLKNPIEMGEVFAPYYSDKGVKQIEELFTAHLKIGGDIITAAKQGDSAKVDALQKEWHANADAIAKLFASINPHYNESEVRKMMYEHLKLTTDEVVLTLQGKYNEAIACFDKVQEEALMMANYFALGIVKQLPGKFF